MILGEKSVPTSIIIPSRVGGRKRRDAMVAAAREKRGREDG